MLQHRAEFAGRTGVVTRVRRVKSKDNVLADPVSRLATATFKAEARKLGATKFVKLPLAPEVQQLMGDSGRDQDDGPMGFRRLSDLLSPLERKAA